MNNSILSCFLVSVALAGCSSLNGYQNQKNTIDNSSLRTNLSEEDIVSAAIFKEIFNKNASAFQKNVSTFCIGVGTNDSIKNPSKALISLFTLHTPKVSPISECSEKLGGIVDKFGKRAISFNVLNLKKNTDASYEAQAGYYEGSLSSQINTYSAKKVNGKWQVNLLERGPIS